MLLTDHIAPGKMFKQSLKIAIINNQYKHTQINQLIWEGWSIFYYFINNLMTGINTFLKK